MNASKYDVKRLDHLGLIAGFCKEIGLNEWVDTHFPKESHNSHITNGQLFIAMLGFTAYPAQTGNELNMLQKTLVKLKMEI